MKTTIRVSCVDQTLKIVDRPLLASGGLNEATVAFDFCAKWNGFAKTGVFYREEDEVYYSILDDDDICIIPWEVYSTPGYFYFTVFGDKGDVRRTANTLKYKAQKGLAGSDMLPSDPTPEVYDQIMGRLSEIEQGAGGGGGGGTGENGGYYRPKVSQPNENTMRVSFTASKSGMPSVAAQDITLPAGKDYMLTPADKQEIAKQAAQLVEAPGEGCGVLVVTVESPIGNTVASHTASEIKAASNEGKAVFLKADCKVYPCVSLSGSSAKFELKTIKNGTGANGRKESTLTTITYTVGEDATATMVMTVETLETYPSEIPGGGTVTDEQIAEAVEAYLKDNPITSGGLDATIDGETLVFAESSTATIENETLIL